MPSFPCPHCPLRFGSKGVLETHLTYVHPPKSTDEEARPSESDILTPGGEPTDPTTQEATPKGSEVMTRSDVKNHMQDEEFRDSATQYPYAPTAPTEPAVGCGFEN